MSNFRDLRCYRPNKTGNGSAYAFQLSYKENEKYDKYQMFLIAAPQIANDESGNNRFDWKGGITVNLGLPDIGSLLSLFERRQDSIDLYHESEKGNKIIKLSKADKGYYINISFQTKDKKIVGPYKSILSFSDVSALSVLFRKFVEFYHNY